MSEPQKIQHMLFWTAEGKVLFEVRFEDDSGYRLTLSPEDAEELAKYLISKAKKAKEYTDGTP